MMAVIVLLNLIIVLFNLVFRVQGGLSTEDPIIVGYVSDIITLRCEHTVAKASLEALAWIKLEEGVQYLPVMAEYDIDDNPPVFFDDSMKGRASIREFPPNLKFHNATLKDAGRYKCQVVPRSGSAISLYYKLNINAKPFNEAVRLSGRSYQDCNKVYLSESTDALLSLTCTASSKPGSCLSWTTDPALVVNQSTAAECNTAANGIVTCERNATIVTKDLKDSVKVTCVTHFDDNQTVVTSRRACVVLVPHGYRSPWVTVVITLVVLWFVCVAAAVFIIIIICHIVRQAKNNPAAASVSWRDLLSGLVLVLLLQAVGVFNIFTVYWKLLTGKKTAKENVDVELGEQAPLREARNAGEEGTNKEGGRPRRQSKQQQQKSTACE